MANPYYNRQTDFLPDSAVRSSDLDGELDAVVRGFDLLGDPTKLSDGTTIAGTDAGTADNYVITNDGSATLQDGQMVTFVPGATNTGAAVADVNGSGNTNIVRNDGSALQAGDLVADVPVMMIYDATNDRWVLVGSTATQSAASYRPAIITETTTARTISASDEGSVIICTNAADISVTLPNDTNDNLPIGFVTHVYAGGDGQVTLVPDTGVTLSSSVSLKTRAANSSLSMIKVAGNEFHVLGDMSST